MRRQCEASWDLHDGRIKQCGWSRGHPGEHFVQDDEGSFHWPNAGHVKRQLRKCRAMAPGWAGASCWLQRGHVGGHLHVTPAGRRIEWAGAGHDRVRFLTCMFIVGWSTLFVIADTWAGAWPLAVLQAAIAGYAIVFEIRCRRREHRGFREAARDRERAGTEAVQAAFDARIAAVSAQLAAAGAAAAGALTRLGTAVGYVHEGAGEELPRLTERAGDLPILAFKAAMLCWPTGDDFGPRLMSLYGGFPFPWGADRAVCLCQPTKYRMHDGAGNLIGEYEEPGPEHVVPGEGCSCGFYAVRQVEDVPHTIGEDGAVGVDVELFGRVIVFERGYRAERQRLLRIVVAGCWCCEGVPSMVIAQIGSAFDAARTLAHCMTSCDEHADFSGANVRMSLPDLAARLGVPVEAERS